NCIEIKVDTRLNNKTTIPHRYQPEAMNNTPGIFRSLYLLAIPELSIETVDLEYQLSPDYSQSQFDLSFVIKDRIENRPEKTPLLRALVYSIDLREENEDRPIYQERKDLDISNYSLTRTVTTQFKLAQPKLWSPDTPHRYWLRIQLISQGKIIDQHDQKLGLKRLEIQNGDVFLNSQRLILRGVTWAEDYGANGAMFDRASLLGDLEMVKQLHANAIRVLHHPPHPAVASLCDSLGIMLLEEIPVEWLPAKRFSSPLFTDHYADYLRETIERDKNHVCILGWGIGGNLYLSEANFAQLFAKLKSNAPTLPGQILYFWSSPPLSSNHDDSAVYQVLSVLDIKKDQLQSELQKWLRQHRDQAKFVLSFGAPLKAPATSQQTGLNEEQQLLKIAEIWQTISAQEGIDGYFYTALTDYLGNFPSARYENNIISNLRPFGLADQQRKKRAAFETLRRLYQEGKVNYNSIADIKAQPPISFPITGLTMVLIFLFMTNTRRYFRENFRRVFVHPHGFYVDIRDGRKIPGSHTFAMALFSSVGIGLILASLLSYFGNELPIDHLLTLVFPGENFKRKICFLSWHPHSGILVFSGLGLALFLLTGFYFKLLGLITGRRCAMSQALIIPFWFGANLILFVPLGMMLFRLLQYPNFVLPIFLGIALLLLWFIFRMIKAMRVMFIWPLARAAIVLIITTALVIFSLLFYYQSHTGLIDYLDLYYQLYAKPWLAAHLF
ncbi:MAG: hypothetical protein ONB13_01660, partial [candidate division KSB1 bacterium]|nr:hypothetical protein [candidate division KSB1 bacterium]